MVAIDRDTCPSVPYSQKQTRFASRSCPSRTSESARCHDGCFEKQSMMFLGCAACAPTTVPRWLGKLRTLVTNTDVSVQAPELAAVTARHSTAQKGSATCLRAGQGEQAALPCI